MQRFISNLLFIVLLCLTSQSLSAKIDRAEVAKKSIWHSPDLQFYLVINDNIYQRYQYTKMSCFRGTAGFLPSVGYFDEVYFDNTFQLVERSDGTYVTRPQDAIAIPLERIKRLPSYCKGEPVNTVLTNFYIFWHTLNEMYSFSHINKQSWVSELTTMIQEVVEIDIEVMADRSSEDILLLSKLQRLIELVQDPHLFLLASRLNKFLRADVGLHDYPAFLDSLSERNTYLKDQAAILNTNIMSFAEDRIHVARNKHIFYIGLSSFNSLHPSRRYTESSSKSINETVASIAKLVRSDDHVVIDLRVNDGGSIEYADRFASLFSTKQATITSYLVKSKKSDVKKIPLSVLKDNGIKVKSLTVLVSRFTASAAEYMTLSLEHLGASIIGERTRGAFSPVTLKSLPNGWIVGLPAFQIQDNQMDWVPERTGIQPDIERHWHKGSTRFRLLSIDELSGQLSVASDSNPD